MKFGKLETHGNVAAGFEPVRKAFDAAMGRLAEERAQLCVYVGEQRVVDLWAAPVDDTTFTPDTLVNVFSSGKSLEAIALATLVSAGRLAYSTPIAEVWPEFATNGKGELTVADLMRHEAGMASFDDSLDAQALLPENIRANRVGEIIERQELRFRRGANSGRREYHAVTRGWIANEVFRRVHPSGLTIGEFLRDELRPLLNADVFIGLSEAELGRRAPVKPIGFRYHMAQGMRPAGRRAVHHSSLEISRRLFRMLGMARKRSRPKAPPPFRDDLPPNDLFNQDIVARGETPSANAHCSARGLAIVASMMASGGQWQGQRLLSEQAWQALHAEPVFSDMGIPTTFSQGGVASFSREQISMSAFGTAFNRGREGFVGWMGLGGSIFQWHPEKRIGFSFVPTALHTLDFLNERGKQYQAEVLRCVR